MKRNKIFLSLIVLATLFAFACSKSDSNDDESKTNITVDLIVGNYTWAGTSAGTQPATITESSVTSVLISIEDQGSPYIEVTGTIANGDLTIASQVFDGDTYTGTGSLDGNVLTLTLHGSNSSGSWNKTIVLTKVVS
jgi:hypothetical protein